MSDQAQEPQDARPPARVPPPASVKRTVIVALFYPSIAFYYAGMSFSRSLGLAALFALLTIASLQLPGHFVPWRTAWTMAFGLSSTLFVLVAWAAGAYARRHGAMRQPRTVWKYFTFFVLSLVVATPIATLDDVPGVSAFKIFEETSPSMAPTVVVGDRVLVDLKAYRDELPKSGDVVAIKSPGQPSFISLKRVVGVPGARVAVTAGLVYRDGEPMPRPTVVGGSDMTYQDVPETIVSADHVYVVGDNLRNSVDSRVYGEIARDDIVGRAEAVLFSLNGAVVAPDRIALDLH